MALFCASPTQVNFQMPSTAPTGDVVVRVNNGGVVSPHAVGSSPAHGTELLEVHPGFFVTGEPRH